MNVQLRPVSPRLQSVGAADDPYKKYWVAILFGFALTAMWLWMPMMETQVGSAHVDTSKPAVDPNAAQSLDSIENPSGAAGFSVAMDGLLTHKSKSDAPIESMLYQAPADPAGAAAAGAPVGGASASVTLAQKLKAVGDKKDGSGWAEKAQRGFTSPKLGSSLSGFGSASGGSSASASVSGGGSSFGSSNAQIGFGSTRGLHDDGSADKAVGGVAALRKVSALAQQAAANRSGDGAHSGNSRIFDGSRAQAISGPGGGGDGGSYAALDMAPSNLKLNDPKLDKKELKEPAPVDVPQAASNDQTKQLAMMALGMIVGGAVGGTAGSMIMMGAQMMMQQQQAAEAERRSQQNLARARQHQGV